MRKFICCLFTLVAMFGLFMCMSDANDFRVNTLGLLIFGVSCSLGSLYAEDRLHPILWIKTKLNHFIDWIKIKWDYYIEPHIRSWRL